MTVLVNVETQSEEIANAVHMHKKDEDMGAGD